MCVSLSDSVEDFFGGCLQLLSLAVVAVGHQRRGDSPRPALLPDRPQTGGALGLSLLEYGAGGLANKRPQARGGLFDRVFFRQGRRGHRYAL